MSFLYQRAPHTAFVMGPDGDDAASAASYVANLLTSEIAVLNGPSTLIWEILETPSASEAIISQITEIYGVPRETVAPSILGFLDSLVSRGLVIHQGEESSL